MTALLQNYPNPFNPETWIPFQLEEKSTVLIRIYDLRGKVVRSLDLGEKVSGYYLSRDRAAYWDGVNDKGERVASGVYFYELEAGTFRAVKRLVILK
jgi:flagellar hook assembly protein FlgD